MPSTLESALSTYFPPTFAMDQEGNLYLTNGLDQGRVWNGLTAAPWVLGTAAPTAAPVVGVSGAGGGASAGTYKCYFRYKTVDGRYSNLSPVRSVVPVANNQFDWSSLTASANTRVTHKELFRTVVNSTEILYLVTTITNATTTYTDTLSDATLDDGDPYPLNIGNNTNMNRFTPPPDKAFCAMFYDRMWYAGDVIYDQGHCEVTQTNTAIVGRGTSWNSRMVNRKIYFPGDTTEYNVDAVGSATAITLGAAFGGTASLFQPYAIKTNPITNRNRIWYSRALEPESVVATENVAIQENKDDLTGIMPCRNFLYALQRRHMFRITMSTQGQCVCAVAQPVSNRGCVNNRSWVVVEGVAFMLDYKGVHRFTEGSGSEHLSGPIQDYWREKKIHFGSSKWFFASHDPAREVIRFHVALGASYLPTHALVYHYREERWGGTEEWPWKFGASCLPRMGEAVRPIYGGEHAKLYKQEGYTDRITARSIRGVCTATTDLTITDSSSDAEIPDANIVGAPVVVVEGRGKGERRRIVAATSTVLTIDQPWNKRPDDKSEYQIGGVPWKLKTGVLPNLESDVQAERAFEAVATPTEQDASLDVRRFLDQNNEPENFDYSQAEGDTSSSVKIVKDEPDAIFQLRRAQIASGNKPKFTRSGQTRLRVDGLTGRRQTAGRYVQVEVRGVQGVDPIEIRDLAVTGTG